MIWILFVEKGYQAEWDLLVVLFLKKRSKVFDVLKFERVQLLVIEGTRH